VIADVPHKSLQGQIPIGRVSLVRIPFMGTHLDSTIDPILWCRWLNDPQVRRHLESKGRWTEKRLREWVAANSAARIMAINVDYRPVGTLKLDNLKRGEWATLGLMIGEKSVWGRGVGPHAIEKACRIARRAGGWGVWAGIREANQGSRRAFAKAGFHEVAQRNGRKTTFCECAGLFPEECYEMVSVVSAWSAKPPRVAVMRRLT